MIGTRRWISVFVVSIKPPRITVWPLKALMVVIACETSIRGAVTTWPPVEIEIGMPASLRDLRLVGVDLHHDQSVRADPRQDLQNETDLSGS